MRTTFRQGKKFINLHLDAACGRSVNRLRETHSIRELTHGEGAHTTLDASSAPDARAATVRSVRSWGTACFVGERGQVTLDVSSDLL